MARPVTERGDRLVTSGPRRPGIHDTPEFASILGFLQTVRHELQ